MFINAPTNSVKWSVDPARTIIILPDYPSKAVNTSLLLWLTMRFSAKQILSITKKDHCVMRNCAIREIVRKLPNTWQHFVMFDNDMSPTESSDLFWEPTTDIVGINCEHDNANAWAQPTDVHCNGFRFNRKVATELPLPWFLKKYSEDGCEQIGCSCQHFIRKSLQAGYSVSRAGWMQHGSCSG